LPRVSVVIPAYNAAETLREAIDSVLGQTLRDLEVVVVDDGSTDATASMVHDYDSRVRCITTPNRGVSAARNTGIAESTGELVAFLDADDLWKPGKLERQIELLESRPEAGVSTTGALRVTTSLEPVREERPRIITGDPCTEILLHSMVLGSCSSSALIRRDLLVDVGGFDSRFSQCADIDLFLRLGRCTRFAVVPEPLFLYRAVEGNMSSDISLLERDIMAVLDRFFEDDVDKTYAPLRRRAYSNHWMILCGSYYRTGDRASALLALVRSLRLDPRNITRPLGLPSRNLRRRLS
jgi:glycosyltransferase involved in cell wall biosynthesis